MSVVFDEQVSGTDMESMNRVNLFLANCYINTEVILMSKVDAERSMVFDKWAEYYLGQEVNKTTLTDFEILSNTEAEGRRKVNNKFLKQALLQIISTNTALKLQIIGGASPEDSKTWNPQMGLFEIEELMLGREGDYRLTMYQSYKESGDKIEIEYYEYRFSQDIPSLLTNATISAYEKYNKGFLEYTKERTKDFFIDSITGGLLDGTKGVVVAVTNSNVVGMSIDGAIEVGKFGIGWNEQTDKNREIAVNLSKYYDGREMEAYQQNGQLMYVNGIRVVNNLYINESRLNILETVFKQQLTPENENYSAFFPKECDDITKGSIEKGLQDSNSAEYKNAFINWYTEGIGDEGNLNGRSYKEGE